MRNSIATWPRVGITFQLRVPSQSTSTSTTTASMRMSRTRFNSKGVPWKRTPAGKKSSMEGPTNPPPEPSAVTAKGRDEACTEVIRTFSSIGRSERGDRGEL